MAIPRAPTNDLVYLNPADTERPIGFNPLSAVPEHLRPIVADGVVASFRHVWPESWGPRLDDILTNAVRALLDVPGATLLMLPRLLIDEAFRTRLVEHHVGDPLVRSFWLNEYAGYLTAPAAKQHAQFGWNNFRVLTITTDRQRVGSMIDALRDIRFPRSAGSTLFFFSTFDDLRAGDPLSHEWRVGAGGAAALG